MCRERLLTSTVYGPVPSWRFGRSLGIDVITPPKKCTFNCIYCQLGKTRIYVSRPEELTEPSLKTEKVLGDLEKVWRRIDLNTVDMVTFSGTGEPTLNKELGKIAGEVKKRIEGIPMAILTNSSLFGRLEVRKNLKEFDMVVAKLDAGDDNTFRYINRPADRKLNLDIIVESIKKLKQEIKGALALEVMLLRSDKERITNQEGKSLKMLMDKILDVNPDLVQLDIPYRPPSESFVKPPSKNRLEEIAKELSSSIGEEKVWVFGVHDRRDREVRWLRREPSENTILELLKRRPCRVVDVSVSLGTNIQNAEALLEKLIKEDLIVSELSGGDLYYSYKQT